MAKKLLDLLQKIPEEEILWGHEQIGRAFHRTGRTIKNWKRLYHLPIRRLGNRCFMFRYELLRFLYHLSQEQDQPEGKAGEDAGNFSEKTPAIPASTRPRSGKVAARSHGKRPHPSGDHRQ